MAQYTQEDVDKIRDSLRKKHDYEHMSDDKKKQFDKTFDAEIEKYRKQGIVESKKSDSDDDAETDKIRENERMSAMTKDSKEKKERADHAEEARKQKEYDKIDNKIAEDQEKLDAERKRKADEAEKKDKDHGDHIR